ERVQPLYPGRRREYGCELQQLCLPAVDRCAAGVQGPDWNLSSGVRACYHANQCFDQAGNESIPRNPFRVPAQRQARCTAVCICRCTPALPAPVEPVRLRARWPGLDSEDLQREGPALFHVELRGIQRTPVETSTLHCAFGENAQRRLLRGFDSDL